MGLWPYWVFPQLPRSKSLPRQSVNVSTKGATTVVLHALRARGSNIFDEPGRRPAWNSRFLHMFRTEPRSRCRFLPRQATHCCKPLWAYQGHNITGKDGESHIGQERCARVRNNGTRGIIFSHLDRTGGGATVTLLVND